MSVENIHQELEVAHEFVTQGVTDLHAADQVRNDIGDVLHTYISVVKALPSGRVLADKHSRVIEGSVTAAEHFDQAQGMVKRLQSDNPVLVEAASALDVATEKLDIPSTVTESLLEIDQLRDTLVAKVAKAIRILSSESLESGQSPVAVAEQQSRSAATAVGKYIDTITGR